MAVGDERAREERRAARWALLDLLWERVLRFFGFTELPYGWVERATRRDLPLVLALLRVVRRRARWLLGPIAVLAVAGVILFATLPATHSMLRNDLDHVPMPVGVRTVTSRDGDFLCLRGCPALTKVVVVEGTVAHWRDRWDQLLVDRGVRMGSWSTDSSGAMTAKAAHFHRRYLTTVTSAPVMTSSRRGASAVDVPSGHVALVLRIEGTRESTPSA